VIGRVDRVELSKNQARGFQALDAHQQDHPEHPERVVFVAGAYPSREAVPAYARYRAEVHRIVDEVNARWGTPDWTPILLDVDDDHPRSVALLRRADVLLVNPIRDGLNLVASEGALVSDREAVLLLSEEAGAWARLGEAAITIAPFDVRQTAWALDQALAMPADERGQQFRRLRALAEARTPEHWLDEQLAAASRA
jgi:trehalose 6-phosphate synthase